MEKNIEHLRLLAIFHYVVAGLMALFSCFPIIHLVIGFALVLNPNKYGMSGNQEKHIVGIVFIVFACIFILVGWTIAALVAYAGRCLSRQKKFTYCFVVACISCAFFPFGTALGVFTLIVLNRDGVKTLFNQSPTVATT
jgi:hypothetical protein